MTKIKTIIGYSTGNVETSPGSFENKIVEKEYYGDVLKDAVSARVTDEIQAGIKLNNYFSIIADPYSTENAFNMRYIKYFEKLWEISSIEIDEIQRPRILIRVGGLYHGDTP